MEKPKLSHIKVSVFADSPTEQIFKEKDDSYRVFLKEPPKEGMANKRLVKILAEFLSPKPRQVKIVGGAHSPNKIVEVQY